MVKFSAPKLSKIIQSKNKKKCLQKKANQIKGKENNQCSKGNNQQSEKATDTMEKKIFVNHMSKKGVNIQNVQ